MNVAYINTIEFSFFSDAQAQFDQIINQLSSKDYEDNEHGEMEKHLNQEGQALLRLLLQGWLNRKAAVTVHRVCKRSQ